MKEVFVIAYYGSKYTKVFVGDWKDVYIGEGIVHESKQLSHYPTPAERFVEFHEPKDKKYNYAKIEKRFYPED